MDTSNPSPQEAPHPSVSDILIAATLDDVSEIRKLMQEASDFKMSRGDDLWGTEPFTDDEVARLIIGGKMFVYKIDGTSAASVLLANNDERMWGDAGDDDSAIYVHRLCVGDSFRGKGVGQKVLNLAEDFALQKNKVRLRLDCPYDNRSLCGYYEQLGFREVRRYDRPNSTGGRNPQKDVYRAALYQKELAGATPE